MANTKTPLRPTAVSEPNSQLLLADKTVGGIAGMVQAESMMHRMLPLDVMDNVYRFVASATGTRPSVNGIANVAMSCYASKLMLHTASNFETPYDAHVISITAGGEALDINTDGIGIDANCCDQRFILWSCHKYFDNPTTGERCKVPAGVRIPLTPAGGETTWKTFLLIYRDFSGPVACPMEVCLAREHPITCLRSSASASTSASSSTCSLGSARAPSLCSTTTRSTSKRAT